MWVLMLCATVSVTSSGPSGTGRYFLEYLNLSTHLLSQLHLLYGTQKSTGSFLPHTPGIFLTSCSLLWLRLFLFSSRRHGEGSKCFLWLRKVYLGNWNPLLPCLLTVFLAEECVRSWGHTHSPLHQPVFLSLTRKCAMTLRFKCLPWCAWEGRGSSLCRLCLQVCTTSLLERLNQRHSPVSPVPFYKHYPAWHPQAKPSKPIISLSVFCDEGSFLN